MRWYVRAVVMLAHAVLLIVIVELVLRGIGQESGAADVFVPPVELVANAALARRYPGIDEAGIRQRLRPPAFASHPRLMFRTRPVVSDAYNVGVENMRYTGFVDARTATSAIAKGVWVFGGSTVFGTGVADDETIPHWLDHHDPSNRYVNFGVSAYDQRHELTKLIHLLEKGYRPSRVVFIDGLNDILSTLASPFEPSDTPTNHRIAYAFDFGPERFERASWRARLRATAIGRRMLPTELDVREDIDQPDALYVRDPWLHYLNRPEQFGGIDLDDAADRLVRTHAKNLSLLDGLAKGFGFEAKVYYQPIGLLAPEPLFLRDPSGYGTTSVFRSTAHLVRAVRGAIADGQLRMTDLSDATCTDCYVDAVHYGSALNEQIARRVIEDASRSD